MYWRVRRVTPQELVKRYSLYVLLAASVLFNGFQYLMTPKKSKVSEQMKVDMVTFAKNVTTHLLDGSYINYMDCTSALNEELDSKTITKLRSMGVLPASDADLKARLFDAQKSLRVCSIKFKDVSTGEPVGEAGLLPVHVYGTIAVHSTDESGAHNFHMQYLLGWVATEEGAPHRPVMLDVQEGEPLAQ